MMARSKLLKAYVCVIFALITAPLLVVIGVSLNPTERFIITLTPSLHWYYAFFQRAEYVNALFGVTLPVACCSAALATLFGTLAARRSNRHS
jgi:putative spermidine/putrescine transport system permease protein